MVDIGRTGVADELAAAASLMMGQADERIALSQPVDYDIGIYVAKA